MMAAPPTRFLREGLSPAVADLVRLVDRALRSGPTAEVARWVAGPASAVLPPVAGLRTLALLLGSGAAEGLAPTRLDAARSAAAGSSSDVRVVSAANVVWAAAVLHLRTADKVIDSATRLGGSCARATGLDEALFAQEILVAAALGQLDGGDVDKARELLDFLAARYPRSPARWVMLLFALADVERRRGAVRSPVFAELPTSLRYGLSHDDLVDLAEAGYRYGPSSPQNELRLVRLADSDPFGLWLPHRTAHLRRASDRAYRVARLLTALGARPLPWMLAPQVEARTPVEARYGRAVVAVARLEGRLWARAAPSESDLSVPVAAVLELLGALAGDAQVDGVAMAAAIGLLDRLFGLAPRFGHAEAALAAMSDEVLSWLDRQARSRVTIETLLILVRHTAALPPATVAELGQAVAAARPEPDRDHDPRSVALLDLGDLAYGTCRCWHRVRVLPHAAPVGWLTD